MKIKFFIPFIFAAIIALFFIVKLAFMPDAVEKSPLIGNKIPPFSIPALEGQGFTSEDLAGKYAMINIFASWCESCKYEQPSLIELSRQVNIPIYGIAWRDHDEKTRDWLIKNGNPFTKVGTDHDGKIAIGFGITGAPESFLVNKQGTIIFRQAGPIDRDVLQKIIATLKNAD